MDPVERARVSAALGWVATGVVQSAWNSAAAWVSIRFHGHREGVQEQATANVVAMMVELARPLNAVVAEQAEMQSRIEAARAQRQVSVVLEAAFLNATQSNDHGKQVLLARAVAERLTSTQEGPLD